MERRVGRLFIYKSHEPPCYIVLDCQCTPFKRWGELPRSFNVHQDIGQLKIFFLAHGAVEWQRPLNNSSSGVSTS
jgi:hypothetical protein